MKEIRGNFLGKGKKIVIVISRFNEFISNQLLYGCVDTLKKSGVSEDSIIVVWTPGSFEIPQVLSKIDTKKFDAVIALGAVIRGETPHFDYVAAEVSKGVARMSQDKKIPIIFGVITADTVEQAVERAGGDAALSALEMLNLYSQL